MSHCLQKSVWLELHQHLAGYEPDALLLSYRPMKNGRIPRCCPGPVLVPNKRVRWLSRIRSMNEMDVRPRLALGNAVLQTADSALCLAHVKVKWFPQPELLRHGLVHNERCSCYNMRGVLIERCGMPVLPRRALFGMRRGSASHEARSAGCIGAGAQHRHACCYINAANE